jgi:hypothetical protein
MTTRSGIRRVTALDHLLELGHAENRIQTLQGEKMPISRRMVTPRLWTQLLQAAERLPTNNNMATMRPWTLIPPLPIQSM